MQWNNLILTRQKKLIYFFVVVSALLKLEMSDSFSDSFCQKTEQPQEKVKTQNREDSDQWAMKLK